MNRNIASALGVLGTAAAGLALAALASGNAYADDITMETTPFVGAKSRAEVQAELLGRPRQLYASASEWSLQSNGAPHLKTTYTSEQAKAEYKASRDLVRALNGEDSGSAFFMIKGPMPQGTAVMGGPTR